MDEVERGAPLRRGVPATPATIFRVPDLVDALDRGMERRVPIVVQAPTGAGKTAGVAAWLAARPEWDAVWLAAPTSWKELREAFSAAVGMTGIDGDTRTPVWWDHVVHHLGDEGRHLVAVVDGADRLLDPQRFDKIVAMLERLPRLTVIFLTCRVQFDPDRRSGRFELVGPELEWDQVTALNVIRRVGIQVPPVIVETLRSHAEGRAEAVLDCARQWDSERFLPEEHRRRTQGLVASWFLAKAERSMGNDAGRVLLVAASLVEVPDDLAAALEPMVPGIGDQLDELVDLGFARRYLSPILGCPVFGVPIGVASKLRTMALEQDPMLCRRAHTVAATLESTAPMRAYHQVCSGEVEAAGDVVLERWRSDRSFGGAVLSTAVLALDPAVIAGDPVLAALRVHADRWVPPVGGNGSSRYANALLALDADDLRVLGLADRLLVEAAVVEVLLDRNMAPAAVRRSAELAEQQLGRVAELEPRARRALASLLTAVAESYIALARPDRALVFAEPVLALAAEDRWIISAFRSSAVMALAYCFNGERVLMREKILQASVYAGFANLEPGPIFGIQWLAEVADALMRGDIAEAETIATRFAAFGRGSVAGEMISDALMAGVRAIRGDASTASRELTRLLVSPRFALQNAFTRLLAVTLTADSLIADGRPGVVHELLAPLSSPATHALCLELYRGAAHLALGRPSLALEATLECSQPALRHAAAFGAKSAAVRAAAHLELKHPDAARAEMMTALHLCPPEWRGWILTILPAASLGGLRDLVAPVVDDDTLAALDRIVEAVAPRGRDFPGALSRKESRLLELLGTDLSLADIARRLYVSINTVKSQTRSVYRKLGVTSRREAVDLAFSLGVRPSIDEPLDERRRA